jgi:hypothetical protein
MPACAGAHDRRSGDNCDFAAGVVGASQFLGDLANDGRLGFLSVNNVVNELKRICVRGGSLHRHNPDSLVSDNNLVAFFDIEKLYGTRAAFFPVNGDCAIDDSGRHLNLLTAESNKGLLVGGYVELGRENAIGWSRGKLSAYPLQYFSALLAKPQDQLVQRFACFGGHFDSGKALIRALPTDLNFSNLEVPAMRQNLVQHFRQDERINDVTA